MNISTEPDKFAVSFARDYIKDTPNLHPAAKAHIEGLADIVEVRAETIELMQEIIRLLREKNNA